MTKYPLIGLIVGSIIGFFVSLYIYNLFPLLGFWGVFLRAFLPLAICSYVVGIWIKVWKEAKQKAVSKKPFRKIEKIQEFSSEDKNLLLRLIRLQRKLSLFFIFISPLLIILYLILLKFKSTRLLYLIVGIATLVGIYVFYKVTIPLRSIQFEFRERGMSMFPKYLPAWKKGTIVTLVGLIVSAGLIVWGRISDNSTLLLIGGILIFLWIGVMGYIVSKINEKALLKKQGLKI